MKEARIQEDLVHLYLRLNGFFVTGHIVHSNVQGRNLTEIDALAVRHRYNEDREREVKPHELLDLADNYTDLAICEVKSRGEMIRFNPALTADERTLTRILRWSGLFLDGEIPDLVESLAKEMAQRPLPAKRPPCVYGPRDVRIRCLFFSPERHHRHSNQAWFVTGPELFGYVHECLAPSQPRSECSTSYDIGLWGDTELIVRYFKDRVQVGPGNAQDLYRYLAKRA